MAVKARAWFYRQLAVKAWDGPGMSPLNACAGLLILLNLVLLIVWTEPSVVETLGEKTFFTIEWVFTGLFTIEYLLRVWAAADNPLYNRPFGRLRYIFSFYALLDLIAILPMYLPVGAVSSTWLRALRLVRIIRLARYGAFSVAIDTMTKALRSRRYELTVSMLFAFVLMLVAASAMWLVEGETNPALSSIPRAIWWSIITMTTVGYGDVEISTGLGKAIASIIALMGVGIVALPAGIMASAFSDAVQERKKKTDKN